MTIRVLVAAALPFLMASAPAFADEPGASAKDPSAPVIIQVSSVEEVAGEAARGDDAKADFGIINLHEATCYAVAPPMGALIEVGESYALVPASNVDDDVRTKLGAAYPKCAIVQVVAHVVTR